MCLSGFDIFTLYFDTYMRTPTFITLHCCRSGRTVSVMTIEVLPYVQATPSAREEYFKIFLNVDLHMDLFKVRNFTSCCHYSWFDHLETE